MMAEFWDKAFGRRAVASLGVLSAALAGGGWFWAWWVLRDRPHSLIIHFNNLVHVNQTGDASDLARIGLFSLVVVFVNFAVALELDYRDWFLGKFLASATLAFAVLIFIGFAAIISVN